MNNNDPILKKGYAICLNEWLDDPNINNELNLLLRISSLTNKDGYCFASNKYLSEKLKITEVSISRKIKKLEKLGYIKIAYTHKGAQITSREIRLTKMLTVDNQKSESTINKNVNPRLTKMLTVDYQKCKSTINKNVKDNNTSNINNTSNNNNNNNDNLKKLSFSYTKSLNNENQKRKKNPKKKEKYYKEFVDVYFEFYYKIVGVKYKFTAADGKAIKAIIKYIINIDKSGDPVAAWEFILNNYNKWNKFYKNQLKIIQVNSNLPNIINNIKNDTYDIQAQRIKADLETGRKVLEELKRERETGNGWMEESY